MANKKKQKKIKRNLNQISKEITSGNPKYREKYQSDAIKYIKNLYNSRQKVIDLFNDYAKIRSEAMYNTKQGTGLKKLSPKGQSPYPFCHAKR